MLINCNTFMFLHYSKAATNQSANTTTSFNIMPSLTHAYECFDDSSETPVECFYAGALFYLRTLALSATASSVLKALVQLIAVFNFGYAFVHRLVLKDKRDEELNYESYERARQNILHQNIRAQIEENDQILAENIFSLDLGKYKFPARNSKSDTKNNVAKSRHEVDDFDEDISLYDMNEDERDAIEAIESVNMLNDEGFGFSTGSSAGPKFDTFKKSTLK